ncbi:MAG TPA: hypothetical protein VFF36_09605, partial [Planctomycetota bacterium]|nr:hypothetical protein [Planctomycetota bacterium]
MKTCSTKSSKSPRSPQQREGRPQALEPQVHGQSVLDRAGAEGLGLAALPRQEELEELDRVAAADRQHARAGREIAALGDDGRAPHDQAAAPVLAIRRVLPLEIQRAADLGAGDVAPPLGPGQTERRVPVLERRDELGHAWLELGARERPVDPGDELRAAANDLVAREDRAG